MIHYFLCVGPMVGSGLTKESQIGPEFLLILIRPELYARLSTVSS